MEFDFFISHASEDKDDFVRPLAIAMKLHGWSVWYDESTLKAGMSLRQAIDAGIIKSRFGIIVLSKSFFRKPWANYELDGINLGDLRPGGISLIPIWHNVSVDDVAGYSLSLANRVALNSQYGLERIVSALEAIAGPPRTVAHPFPNAPWKQETCPNCGGDAQHVGYEVDSAGPDFPGPAEVSWIECRSCGYKSASETVAM